jgi:hypothetical protein
MHQPEPSAMAIASQAALFALFDHLVANGILQRRDIEAIARKAAKVLAAPDSLVEAEAVKLLNGLAAEFSR